jgi:hypothetical protein
MLIDEDGFTLEKTLGAPRPAPTPYIAAAILPTLLFPYV